MELHRAVPGGGPDFVLNIEENPKVKGSVGLHFGLIKVIRLFVGTLSIRGEKLD